MLSSPIEEIKNRLNVVEVVGSYIKLQKAGANLRAVCPFHSEKKPSFFVSPARQIWHCFGCNTGGDIFKFVMQIEGVEFGDALRLLAQKAGIELKRSPEYAKLQTERQRLLEICELSALFFEKQLEESKTGKEAKVYLLNRGISHDSLRDWRIGYAPDVWQGLSDFLASRGYKKEEIAKTGLGLESEKGSFYDRFRGRIIFPVFDLNSQVIGFGGRVFKEKDNPEIAKYVNSPQTMLYDKGRTLYGLDKARVEIRKKDFVVLVEGYVDAIMSFQAGLKNVVAASGTALTNFQLGILKRYSENLLTAFDMDVAGDSATKRGIDLAQVQGFNIKVIVMPEGKDPADIISQDTGTWDKMVNNAKSILQFYFDTTFSRYNLQDAEGKRKISRTLLPVIKTIPNRIEQFHWVQELAEKLGVKEEAVEEELKKTTAWTAEGNAYTGISDPGPAPVKSRKELLADRIASLVIKDPQAMMHLLTDDCLTLLGPKHQIILADLKDNKPCQDQEFFNYLGLKAEVEQDQGIDCQAEVRTCLREMANLDLKQRLDSISRDLRKAEQDKDLTRVDSLMQEFNKLAVKLL